LKKESEINDGNSTIRIIKTVKRRGGGVVWGKKRRCGVSLRSGSLPHHHHPNPPEK